MFVLNKARRGGLTKEMMFKKYVRFPSRNEWFGEGTEQAWLEEYKHVQPHTCSTGCVLRRSNQHDHTQDRIKTNAGIPNRRAKKIFPPMGPSHSMFKISLVSLSAEIVGHIFR